MKATPFKPQITPNFIIRTLHLKTTVVPRPNQPFSKVITDSRKAEPGCLFIALKGEKVDGQDFIESAIAQGARGIVCRRGLLGSHYKDVCFFSVEDPLNAYRRIAAAWRREFSIPMVVVAGSSGKTTTKEFLAAILQGKWSSILKTQGSQNGFIGIPNTLLELRTEHEAAVIEVGIDEIGAMQQHMNLVGANSAVLTSIGPEHLLHLRDLPTVAREEGVALSHTAKAGGMVAVNLDDPWIRPHLSTLREGRKVPYSLQGATSPIDMISAQVNSTDNTLTFEGLGIPPTTLPLPLLGKHNASNLLAAVTIAAGWGLTGEEILAGIKKFKGTDARSEVYEMPDGTQVIKDYYNANPSSMAAGMDLLAQLSIQKHCKSTWLCLADMLELGPGEEGFHRELANKIIQLNMENVLLHGPRMEWLADELKKRDFKGYSAHFTSHSEVANALLQGLRAGDAILIKGSRGMRMEEVWKILDHDVKHHRDRPSKKGENFIPHP